jgi:hypothetical protein
MPAERQKSKTRRGVEVAEQMRAALLSFQSRRTRTCRGCGQMIFALDEIVRVSGWAYHDRCAPPTSAA